MGLVRVSGTTVSDSSGNGNNGTVANTTWTANGKFGSGLVFNGTNAKVTIPDAASLHLTTAMTLEAWVNPAAVHAQPGVTCSTRATTTTSSRAPTRAAARPAA